MLCELIKNSRRSDRELAKAIGTSQPTATRLRSKLERDGSIKEYIAVPAFQKLGYALMATTLLKLNRKYFLHRQDFDVEKAYKKLQEIPNSLVVLADWGMGAGYDVVVISFHPTYAAFDNFQLQVKEQMKIYVSNSGSFLINLEDTALDQTFSFKTLINQLKQQ